MMSDVQVGADYQCLVVVFSTPRMKKPMQMRPTRLKHAWREVGEMDRDGAHHM